MTTQADILDELDRLIVVAETEIARLTAAILGLQQAGADTTEAESLLRDYKNALPNLRRQRWAIPAREAKPE